MPPEILNGALAAGGGLFQGLANIGSTLLANKANRELAQYSFEQQKQMIAEQNKYNSPVEQMKRYEEAGLNPALIYGNGTSSAGNQSSIAKYEAPTMVAPDVNLGVAQAIQLMLSAKKTEAEIENINSQTARTQEDTTAAIMRNAWESFMLGNPTTGWNFNGSRKLTQTDLGIESQRLVNMVHQTQADIGKLNVKEKNFFLDNLLPLTLKLKQMEIEGVGYENAMKAIDTTIWRDKRISEINSNPLKILGRVGQGFLESDSPVGRALKDYLSDTLTPFGTIKRPWQKAKNWLKNIKK